MTYLLLDIVFCVILIISVIIGIKKGAVKIFLSLLSTVCAALLTYFFNTSVSTYLYNKFIKVWVVNRIYSSFESNSVSTDVLPKFITKGAESFGIELENLKLSNAVTKENITELVDNNLYKTLYGIINLIVSIVLFVLFLLVLKFLFRIFDKLVKHSFISGFNSVLGGAFGLINGVIILLLICFVISICFKNALPLPSYFSEKSVTNSLFYRLFLYIF